MADCKQCFKCGEEKSLDDFYSHKMMADGHLNKCKDCTKKEALTRRWENIEAERAYDRERGKRPHRLALSTDTTKRWRAADPRRLRAHNAVGRAIRRGDLVRRPCERCGAAKSEAHHEDYDLPLDVVWLCCPCHKQRHKEIDAERSAVANIPVLTNHGGLTAPFSLTHLDRQQEAR